MAGGVFVECRGVLEVEGSQNEKEVGEERFDWYSQGGAKRSFGLRGSGGWRSKRLPIGKDGQSHRPLNRGGTDGKTTMCQIVALYQCHEDNAAG